MTVRQMLKENNMTVYKLSQRSKIPYATCSDIVNGKAQLGKCSAETVYKLAQTLHVSMESILAPCFAVRSSFENFKSAVCHRVKELGDTSFIADTLESDDIRVYFRREWYPESLYLLAMLDYISRLNDVPLCDEYDDIRRCKLPDTLYPSSVLALTAASGKADALTLAESMAIPEFKRFNIIESEIRNVI